MLAAIAIGSLSFSAPTSQVSRRDMLLGAASVAPLFAPLAALAAGTPPPIAYPKLVEERKQVESTDEVLKRLNIRYADASSGSLTSKGSPSKGTSKGSTK